MRLENLFATEVENALVDRSVQVAENLYQTLDTRISLLTTLSELPFMRSTTFSVEEKLQMLTPMAKRHGLLRFGISDLQGMTFTTDGHVMNIGDREYFLSALKGSTSISRLLTCYILNIPIIVYATPLYDQQDKVHGVFFVTEDTRIISQLLQGAKVYSTKGTSIIITTEGNILDGTENTTKQNIFADFRKENSAKAVTLLQQGVSQHLSQQTRLTLNHTKLCVVTTPIRGTADWNLLTTIPEGVAMGKTQAVLNLTIYTLLLVAGCILLVLLYVSRLQRRYARQKGMATVAIESAGLYYITVDLEGKILSANKYFTLQTGLSLYQLQNTALHEISLHITQEELTLLLEQDEPFELQLRTHMDDTIYVQWTPLPDRGENTLNLLGTDLTLQRKNDQEQRSHMAQRNLQMIFDNVPVPLILRNLTDAVIMCNSALYTLAGKESDLEILGTSFPEVLPYENYPVLHNALEGAFAHSAPVTVEHSLLYPDGHRRYFRTTQVPLYDDTHTPSSVLTVFIDITDSKNMQKNLVKEVNRLQNLLETSPIAVLISVKGKVRFMNLCAKKMTTLTEGENTRQILEVSTLYSHIQREINRGRTVPQVEARLFDRAGTPHDLLVNVAPTEYQGEMGAIAWAMEVTELKNIEKELMAARDTAEAATHAKSEFLANMSHEIRTPMNAIIGMNHLVLQTQLSLKQQDYLKKIDLSAKNLLRILNDILDFSKIEADQLDIEYADFRLDTLLNDSIDLVSVKAREKNLKVHLRMENNVPVWVQGDPVRLGQVIQNLLNNAVKFTEQGSITVTVSLRESPRGEHILLFTIRDTGVGMTPEQSKFIFQSFTQADASTTRKYGGTGLGLAICKKLVELMRGNIYVTSAVNQGTTFGFTVHLLQAKNPQPSNDSPMVPQSSLKDLHLLLVEDNTINQEVALEILQGADIHVDVANNGQEALDMVHGNHYDIVLMDIQMPVMDGITATRALREDRQLQNLPIIAMTAHAMTGDREKSLAAGMNDYITKPISPDNVYETLRRWLPMARPVTRHTPATENPAAPPFSIVGMDKDIALSRLLGNDPLLKRLLTDFYSTFANCVAELRQQLTGSAASPNGSTPLLSPENLEASLRLSHTLKGVAANLALHTIYAAAQQLETLLKASQSTDSASPTPAPDLNTVCTAINALETALQPTLESIATTLIAPAALEYSHKDTPTASSIASRLARLSAAEVEEAQSSLHKTRALLHLNDPESENAFNAAKNILGDTFTEEVQNVLLALDNFDFVVADEQLEILLNALNTSRNTE
ncbi:MAG: ATP-binding protein [Desulfovibrionaceae bacterium]